MNLVQRLRNGRADQDELNDAADRIEQLESENAELRKDAERYRAYRAYFRDNDADLEIAHALALTDSDAEFDAIWDKEIDAALGFAEPAADVANECAAAIRRMIEELK